MPHNATGHRSFWLTSKRPSLNRAENDKLCRIDFSSSQWQKNKWSLVIFWLGNRWMSYRASNFDPLLRNLIVNIIRSDRMRNQTKQLFLLVWSSNVTYSVVFTISRPGVTVIRRCPVAIVCPAWRFRHKNEIGNSWQLTQVRSAFSTALRRQLSCPLAQ